MITVVDNVEYLKENPKSLIDIKKIIAEKIDKIKSMNLEKDAEIIISGDVNSFSFNVSSKDSETLKLIREKLNL